MNYEDMNNAIIVFCQKRDHNCQDCPLNIGDGLCYISYGNMTEEDRARILRNYLIITKNTVNHPSHYTQGGIECIDAMTSAFGKKAVEDFCLCNVFKYVWRTRQKNGLEDCKKAQWYMNKYVEMVENEVDK